MSYVIEIKNLSKEYQLGIIGRDTFYRDFQSLIAKIFKKNDPNSPLNGTISKGNSNKFLALNKINLDVKQGDIVGIIFGFTGMLLLVQPWQADTSTTNDSS